MKHILTINGSLRQQSFNGQLLQYLSDTTKHEAVFSNLNYAEVPFFNEDIEHPLPETVYLIQKIIERSDGIVIAVPEYNGSFPGVLKNLLDWLSRPLVYQDYSSGTVLKHKPVTIVSAAGSSAGINARSALHILLERLSMNVIYDNGTGIALNRAAFTTNKLSLTEDKKKDLDDQMTVFLNTIEKSTSSALNK